jgi:hypothetical protein
MNFAIALKNTVLLLTFTIKVNQCSQLQFQHFVSSPFNDGAGDQSRGVDG